MPLEAQRTDDLEQLLAALPPGVRAPLSRHPDLEGLIEIVLDLGRPPEARFPRNTIWLGDQSIAREDLAHAAALLGPFTSDNRAGIERTLHRISAIRNRQGDVVGLTFRVGRAIFGTIDIVRDLIESGDSTLLVGPPGVGKTTLLRESARVLADEVGKRVIVVDTSNEIAGDGDIPHPGIGRARRMQVAAPSQQHAVMIEAVENHMPEVIVIDEIGTEAEALAARTIAERGVQLIATAHGHSLANLLSNPTLADLLGGVRAVTLGDAEARRQRRRKTALERRQPPTFDILIEIHDRDRLAVHRDVAAVVDSVLRGRSRKPELRLRLPSGDVEVQAAATEEAIAPAEQRTRPVRIYPYAMSEDRLERAIRSVSAPARIARSVKDADVVLTLESQARRNSPKLRAAMVRDLPVHTLPSESAADLEEFLAALTGATSSETPEGVGDAFVADA